MRHSSCAATVCKSSEHGREGFCTEKEGRETLRQGGAKDAILARTEKQIIAVKEVAMSKFYFQAEGKSLKPSSL